MQLASIGGLAPAALLLVAFIDCSLIKLPFLLLFLFIQHKSLWAGISVQSKVVLYIFVLLYALAVMACEALTTILWYIKGDTWSWTENWFPSLLSLYRFNPWISLPYIFAVLASLLFAIITVALAIIDAPNFLNALDFSWGGFQFRAVMRSILLPAVQLVTAVARPCWISFPFFICSCVGLFHWAISGNFVGLSWGWTHLLVLTGFEVVLLYVYQLPLSFPEGVLKVSDYLGLFRVSQGEFGWLEITQSAALLILYILLSVSIFDIQEEGEDGFYHKHSSLPQTYNGSMINLTRRRDEENCITERLLGSPKTLNITNQRPTSNWTKTLSNSKVMQIISINFSVYGFPICLLLLSLWSFKYASISAFFILVYVGLVLFSFPSALVLWRMNTALLLFILFWAISTYMFNAVFTVLHDELDKDTRIWNTVGFWHYPVPGLFLLVQFVLGVLIGSSMYFSNVSLRSMHIAEKSNIACDVLEEESQDGRILSLAVFTWCIHRSSNTLSLVLLFFSGAQLGIIGAIYMGFFLLHLLKPEVAARTRHQLILFCGIHFGMLYLSRLDLIAAQIAESDSWVTKILSLLDPRFSSTSVHRNTGEKKSASSVWFENFQELNEWSYLTFCVCIKQPGVCLPGEQLDCEMDFGKTFRYQRGCSCYLSVVWNFYCSHVSSPCCIQAWSKLYLIWLFFIFIVLGQWTSTDGKNQDATVGTSFYLQCCHF